MSKFYCPCGKVISEGDFIKLYADSYYLDNRQVVSNAQQSSRYVEDKMDCLLKNGICSTKDVARILAWKIGKIDHKNSNDQFVYASDWENAESLNVTRYGNPFDLAGIANYIINNKDHLEKKADSDPQGVLNELRDVSVKGLGTTYLVTLLYFLSKGKYPIYDRFAYKGVKAILQDKKPGEIVDYEGVPDKTSKKRFESFIDNEMTCYVKDLTTIFGERYKDDRDIDRALWVYGHLFKDSEK